MSNKELNLSILDRLYQEIYRRIDGWNLPDGEYTCGMIDEYVREEFVRRRYLRNTGAKFQNRAYQELCGKVDWQDDSKKLASKEIHIQVDGFRCSFFEYELVPITMKFESICNIRASNRQRFYKEDIINPKAV